MDELKVVEGDNYYAQLQSNADLINLTMNITNGCATKNASDPDRLTLDPDVGKILWQFVGPVIFVIGLVGNALILLVMTNKFMRGTSTCVYLTAMAITDILVLLTGMIPEWLEWSEIVIPKEVHPALCKTEKFAFYTCGDTAIWIRVVFTIDRFIALCFPMERTDLCLPHRARYYVLLTVAAAIAKNFHVFWTRGAQYAIKAISSTKLNCLSSRNYTSSNISVLISNCGSPTPATKYFESFIRPWIAFTLVSVLPFAIILICNIFIIRSLLELKYARTKSFSTTGDKSIFQMTAMCLSASFCFLVCVTPSIVLLIGKPYWSKPPSFAYDVTKAINNQLYYVNHSANFFLYCITGEKFRELLAVLLRCKPMSSYVYRYHRSSLASSSLTAIHKARLSSDSITFHNTKSMSFGSDQSKTEKDGLMLATNKVREETEL